MAWRGVGLETGVAAQLVFFFLVTQVLGLAVAASFVEQGVQATLVNEDPEDPVNAVGLVAYIVAVTALLLFFVAVLKWAWVLALVEALAVLGTGALVFGAFFPAGPAFLYAVLLVALRVALRESLWVKNAASVVAVAAVGALLGVSLGVVPVLVGMALLAGYDIVAVFFTRHMLVLARSVARQNLSFTFTLPAGGHAFQLGTGDLVVPLMFAASVVREVGGAAGLAAAALPASLVMAASLAGLWGTLAYCARTERALPALPLQVALMLLAWGAYGALARGV